MKKVNAAAFIFLGVYLLAVLVHNNTNQLVNFISNQISFAKWATAIFILFLLYELSPNPLTKGLIVITVVAMLLDAENNGMILNLENEITNFFGVK